MKGEKRGREGRSIGGERRRKMEERRGKREDREMAEGKYIEKGWRERRQQDRQTDSEEGS